MNKDKVSSTVDVEEWGKVKIEWGNHVKEIGSFSSIDLAPKIWLIQEGKEIKVSMTTNMITEEEYLKALEVVKAYQRQVNGTGSRELKTVNIGDFVELVDNGKGLIKDLTIGKLYEVLEIRKNTHAETIFSIKNDNNKRKSYHSKSDCWFRII